MPAFIVTLENTDHDTLTLEDAKALLKDAEADINRLYDEVLFWKGQVEDQVTMEGLKKDLDMAHALRTATQKKLEEAKAAKAEAEARASKLGMEKRILEEELKGGRPA
jgi:multidrug resistance efflux pump